MSVRRENFAMVKTLGSASITNKQLCRLKRPKPVGSKVSKSSAPPFGALLTDLANRTKPRQPLFPGGAQKYYDVFKQTCANLGLSDRYVPHSLRHGGATSMKLRGWSLEDIMQRGRWKSACPPARISMRVERCSWP